MKETPQYFDKFKTLLTDVGGNVKLIGALVKGDEEKIAQLTGTLQNVLDETPKEARKRQSLDIYVSLPEQEKLKNEKSSSTQARRNAVYGKENVLVGAADFDSLSESSQRDPTRKDKMAGTVEKYG